MRNRHMAELARPTQDQPWWQRYYQLYHYHPPPGRKPTVFGPYLLLQTLGEGEFGKVKLGIHIKTGHEVIHAGFLPIAHPPRRLLNSMNCRSPSS